MNRTIAAQKMSESSNSKALLVLYTLIWPGLGHLQQGRAMAAALLIFWALAADIGLLFAPALLLPRSLFAAELALIVLIAVIDVVRVRTN